MRNGKVFAQIASGTPETKTGQSSTVPFWLLYLQEHYLGSG